MSLMQKVCNYCRNNVLEKMSPAKFVYFVKSAKNYFSAAVMS